MNEPYRKVWTEQEFGGFSELTLSFGLNARKEETYLPIGPYACFHVSNDAMGDTEKCPCTLSAKQVKELVEILRMWLIQSGAASVEELPCQLT